MAALNALEFAALTRSSSGFGRTSESRCRGSIRSNSSAEYSRSAGSGVAGVTGGADVAKGVSGDGWCRFGEGG